ncbi:hypothetical protein [Candidatus Halocynthiibacter alkanivorans]|uniref:hypothetical protein n=1 Tax=Candidatus Halocynthiibacter alkanivorans TaxID=2267619 RepID=UPI000DF1B788|nr:hypothetical protein [Candidatus Halocynthiibacter alkanivorans]
MNKYSISVLAIAITTLFLAVVIGLKYSQASLIFGIVALALAPIAIHKVSDRGWALGLLAGLAIFASFPAKKLFQIEGFVTETLLTLIYFGTFWVIGMGWKRSWK